MVNDSYDYKASKRTSTLSAVSSRHLLAALPFVARAKSPGSTVARRRFKSRALKPVHLNAVKDKEEANEPEDEEEKVRAPLKNSAEKDRKNKRYGNHYSNTYHHHHHRHHHHHLHDSQRQQRRHAPQFRDDQPEIDMPEKTLDFRSTAHGTGDTGKPPGLSVSEQHGPMRSP